MTRAKELSGRAPPPAAALSGGGSVGRHPPTGAARNPRCRSTTPRPDFASPTPANFWKRITARANALRIVPAVRRRPDCGTLGLSSRGTTRSQNSSSLSRSSNTTHLLSPACGVQVRLLPSVRVGRLRMGDRWGRRCGIRGVRGLWNAADLMGGPAIDGERKARVGKAHPGSRDSRGVGESGSGPRPSRSGHSPRRVSWVSAFAPVPWAVRGPSQVGRVPRITQPGGASALNTRSGCCTNRPCARWEGCS